MNLPDKCPFCASPVIQEDGKPCVDPEESWAAYNCASTIHFKWPPLRRFQSIGCLERERDALAAQIESLKNPAAVAANVLRGQIVESRGFVGDHRSLLEACGTYEIPEAVAVVEKMKARVKELEEARTKAAANSLANMLHVEGLNRKIARLIAEGDALRKVVARDYPRTEFCDAWDKAKEWKP